MLPAGNEMGGCQLFAYSRGRNARITKLKHLDMLLRLSRGNDGFYVHLELTLLCTSWILALSSR